MTNHELAQLVETNDEWIRTRTGICTRHLCDEYEQTSDLVSKALKGALDSGGFSHDWPQALIVATSTADQVFPSVASLAANKLGMSHLIAFDINAACSGFLYALELANSMIVSGTCQRVAVVGADRMSSIVDWQDRNTCVLFGDGAGAVLLERAETNQLWTASLGGNPSLASILEANPKIVMAGQEVFRHAVDKMVDSAVNVCNNAFLAPKQIDWLVPHQANIRIMDMVAMRLGIDKSKVVVTLPQQANTAAATIPLGLDHLRRYNNLQRGMKLLLTAAGAGFTWGSILLEY